MSDKKIWGSLLHLGKNMWSDKPYPRPVNESGRYTVPLDLPPDILELKKLQRRGGGWHDRLRFDENTWRSVTAYLQQKGVNLLIIDIGEGMRYPSHPEIAAKDAWSPDKMRSELKRLREMGIELIPKLNFSTTHNAWMGEYRRMISTPEYYRVCEDLIKDTCEIFETPRFMHLGYDEEDYDHMRSYDYVPVRQGELWWHDFMMTVKCVEKCGVRAWIWSDKIWHHRDEFVKRMPKSVLQSNWYYLDDFNPSKTSELYPMVHAYDWLEEAGFDQVPCVSNCGNWNRLKTNADLTAKYCRKIIDPSRLKGMLMAPWNGTVEPFKRWINESTDMLAAARKIIEA
jgi:hypothetical protein